MSADWAKLSPAGSANPQASIAASRAPLDQQQAVKGALGKLRAVLDSRWLTQGISCALAGPRLCLSEFYRVSGPHHHK